MTLNINSSCFFFFLYIKRVYEVNLAIDRDIEEEYILWLEAHIPEVLIVDGFKHAVIYSREASDDPSVDRAFYTVQYSVESREALEAYFRFLFIILFCIPLVLFYFFPSYLIVFDIFIHSP